jgi:hypothetical protein
MKALAALILTAAAVLALASTEAGAAQPLQSPVVPTATRSRWRDLPATPTPDYSQAQHGRIRDARYEVRLPLVGN